MRSELTVAMIVKDEERDLPGCLDSIRALGDVVHEVCIYDTGSSDATVALAQAWGARVERGYWDDDFSRARNAVLGMASTRWVLVLDADDRVYASAAELRNILTVVNGYPGSARWGIAVVVDDERQGVIVSSSPGPRIIQPRTMCYRNRLHEVVVLRDGGGQIRWASAAREAVRIAHIGYSEDPADRAARNTRLSELEVAEARQSGDADRLAEALTHLGRAKSMSGDLNAAVAHWREVRTLASASPHRTFAGERLAETLVDGGEPAEALPVLDELRQEGLSADQVNWLRARALEALGRTAEALEAIRAVEEPRSTFSERKSPGAIFFARARLAAALGYQAEAISSLVALVTRSRESSGGPRVLLDLWGDRPLDALAQVLLAAAGDQAGVVAGEFEACGRDGATVARTLRAQLAQGKS